MQVIRDKISIEELKNIAEETFGNIIKAVVDTENEIMAVGCELHSDGEALLIEDGSMQETLWGINIYPELRAPEWVEFDALINLKPSHGNNSRSVDDPETMEKILKIVSKLIKV